MTTATRSATGRLARALGYGLVLALAAGLTVGGLLGARLLPVLTGSMAPYAPTGALVLTVPVDGRDVVAGDVVAFKPPAPYETVGDRPVMHRVTEVGEMTNGRTWMTTQGDANPAVDPWQVSTRDVTFARAVFVLPGAGWLFTGGPTATGALVLGLAALLLGVAALRGRQDPAPARTAAPRRGGVRTVHREAARQTVTVTVALPAAEWDAGTGARQVIRARRALERSTAQLGLTLTDMPTRDIATSPAGDVRITLTALAQAA
ncbi:signal peptidase I [Modestobacter sp. SSW1-42]|uniref:signal peptidase I n=1 Tax=Modestobacter sp. SSW1-42 TaxID=596372 RepID=UPI0039881F2F